MDYIRFDVRETAARLRESLATIVWGVEQTPAEWTQELPKFYPADSWTVAMNVAHLALYDEEIANPVLKVLADGGDGATMHWSTLEENFASAKSRSASSWRACKPLARSTLASWSRSPTRGSTPA